VGVLGQGEQGMISEQVQATDLLHLYCDAFAAGLLSVLQ
jgi:hypothetical protein